jgi:glutaminyl-peptide cyclotransferase
LDLIGTPDPSFYNYSSDTAKWYYLLAKAEEKLANAVQFENYFYNDLRHKYFQNYTIFSGVEDDHTPFLSRSMYIEKQV